MNPSDLLKKMQSITNLPTLPVIVLEANKLLQDYDSPLEPLVDLLAKDQTLVFKILRLVNSSFYGFKSKVNTLRHAVTLLGYNTVRNAIVTVNVIDSLKLKKELNGFEIDAFWKHSIGVAVVTRNLAAKTRLVALEDAFTAGLLHDIGKIVLANFFPQELITIFREVRENQMTFFDAELHRHSYPHNLIGGYLAQRWMLSEALVQTIQHHHIEVDCAFHSGLAAIVHIGDCLEHMMRGDASYHLNVNNIPETIKGLIQDIQQLGGRWLAEVKKEMEAACDFFNKG